MKTSEIIKTGKEISAERLEETFKHWGYGSDIEQTTIKSEGNTLTEDNIKKCLKPTHNRVL